MPSSISSGAAFGKIQAQGALSAAVNVKRWAGHKGDALLHGDLEKGGWQPNPSGSVIQRNIPPSGRVQVTSARAIARDDLQHDVAMLLIALANGGDVFIQVVILQVLRQHVLREGAGMQIGSLLGNYEMGASSLSARTAIPGACPAKRSSRTTPATPCVPAARRPPGVAIPLEAQLAVRIILDEHGPASRRRTRQRFPFFPRIADPGGVLEIRHGIE